MSRTETITITAAQFIAAVEAELISHFAGTELRSLVELEAGTVASFAYERARAGLECEETAKTCSQNS